jgi:hypothetical protein
MLRHSLSDVTTPVVRGLVYLIHGSRPFLHPKKSTPVLMDEKDSMFFKTEALSDNGHAD